MKDYYSRLKHPNWQKKRLEIFERDGFKCQLCGEKNETLVVHHWIYCKDREPWEYDNSCFSTLCDDCHKNSPEVNGLWGNGENPYLSVVEMLLYYINPLDFDITPTISSISMGFKMCSHENKQYFIKNLTSLLRKMEKKKKDTDKTNTHTQGSVTS